METNNTEIEQTETLNTQAVDTEEKQEGVGKEQVSYGKFKDLDSLLKAYESLEAEFTRRSQRLKELEGEVGNKKTEQTATADSENIEVDEKAEVGQGGTDLGQNAVDDANYLELEQEVIKRYLQGVLKSKSSNEIIGGVGLVAPPHKPKSLEEASNLAKQYIKLKGEN